MAFAFTCYGNDETIASTSIYATGINISYTVPYGETLNLAGFPDSVRFTANPATNCSFTRWVYRLGSTTGTVQYSADNPFTYSGSQDIFIRAEGIADVGESTWSISSDSIGTITNDISKSVYLDKYTMCRYSVSFNSSGTVTFFTSGTIDTYGFLSTSPNWDSYNGIPTSFLASGDQEGENDNFSITYNVTAGTIYYVWVRSYTGTDTGQIQLNITKPQGQGSVTWKISSAELGMNGGEYKGVYGTGYFVFRCSVSFLNSGVASFCGYNVYGNMICYLSTTPEWNHQKGEPYSYLTSSTNNQYHESNPSFTYNVQVGTTYYFWVRCYSIGSTSQKYDGKVIVAPPTISKPSKWDWNISNGRATALQTSRAYDAVVNKTYVKDFSHAVWNDLVYSWNELLYFKNVGWKSYYCTLNSTTLPRAYWIDEEEGTYREDYTLLAEIFNSLLYNVKQVCNPGINYVSTGDEVLGSYFITLAKCLNDMIDTL